MSKGFLNSHSSRRCGLVWPNRMQAGILLPPNYARHAASLTHCFSHVNRILEVALMMSTYCQCSNACYVGRDSRVAVWLEEGPRRDLYGNVV